MNSSKLSASHFAKLLKDSKVVGQVDPQLEQVYTTFNGYLHKTRDFGLKRSLPAKLSPRSPWIRLKSLDTPYRQLDYRSAAAEASLVQMWRQIEVGVKTARKNHAVPNTPSEPNPIRIEYSRFDDASHDSAHANSETPRDSSRQSRIHEKGRTKHIWTMDQREFDKFLELMRSRRKEFKKFLEAKENRKANAQDVLASDSSDQPDGKRTVEVDLYQYAQRNPDQIRRDIEDFMAYLAENETIDRSNYAIPPMTHPNLGLNYAHFDQLHNERLTPAIPGRILDQADVRSSRQTVSFAGIVGSMQRSSHIDLPATSFEPDVNGYHNLDQGKAGFRVETASIDPYELPSARDFQGFSGQFDQPTRYTDPRNRPKALGPNRLTVQVREATQSDASRPNANARIGSMEWVGSEPPKRQGTIVLDFLSSVSRSFQSSKSSSNSQDGNTTGPNSGSPHGQSRTKQTSRINQAQNDQLMKVLKDLVGGPSSE